MGAEALGYKYPNRLNIIKASRRGAVGGHVWPWSQPGCGNSFVLLAFVFTFST